MTNKAGLKSRRSALSDPRLLASAKRFLEAEAEKVVALKPKTAVKMSAKARFKRAVIVTKFTSRMAAQSAQKETLPGLSLAIAEAVADHWAESKWFVIIVSMGAMIQIMMCASMQVSAQGAAG